VATVSGKNKRDMIFVLRHQVKAKNTGDNRKASKNQRKTITIQTYETHPAAT
jgi:hypothetical protein